MNGTMKISTSLLILAGVIAASVVTVAVEFHMARSVKKVREQTLRCRNLTELNETRAARLSRQAAEMEEEIRRIETLPLVPAGSPSEVRAAVEQCAAEVGLSCQIEVQNNDDAVELMVSLRASLQELFRFLAALTARRELLLVKHLEGNRWGSSLFAVELKLKAFCRKESP